MSASYSRAPAYQNGFAFKHNPNSRKTKVILSIPNTGLCARCHDIIEWKKKYRKYKPLDKPRKCTSCHKLSVKLAYHVICGDCSSAKKVCSKCLEVKDIFQPADAAIKEIQDQIDFLETHKGAVPGLPERQRRAVLRELYRDLSEKTGVRRRPAGDEGEEDVDDAADCSADAAQETTSAGGDAAQNDTDSQNDDDEDDSNADDEDVDDGDEDDKFISEEAKTLKNALAAARAKRRAMEASERKREKASAAAAASAASSSAAAAVAEAAPGGSDGDSDGDQAEDGVDDSAARADPWVLQQRLAKLVVTPRPLRAVVQAAPAATRAAAPVATKE